MCVFFYFLYNFRLKHFSSQEEISKIWPTSYIGLHVKNPLFLSDFNETCIFSTVFFFKKYSISYVIKIRPAAAELFHVDGLADGQTDKYDETDSSFSQFWEHVLNLVPRILRL